MPSRTRANWVGLHGPGVGEELSVDGIGDASLQTARMASIRVLLAASYVGSRRDRAVAVRSK